MGILGNRQMTSMEVSRKEKQHSKFQEAGSISCPALTTLTALLSISERQVEIQRSGWRSIELVTSKSRLRKNHLSRSIVLRVGTGSAAYGKWVFQEEGS